MPEAEIQYSPLEEETDSGWFSGITFSTARGRERILRILLIGTFITICVITVAIIAESVHCQKHKRQNSSDQISTTLPSVHTSVIPNTAVPHNDQTVTPSTAVPETATTENTTLLANSTATPEVNITTTSTQTRKDQTYATTTATPGVNVSTTNESTTTAVPEVNTSTTATSTKRDVDVNISTVTFSNTNVPTTDTPPREGTTTLEEKIALDAFKAIARDIMGHI